MVLGTPQRRPLFENGWGQCKRYDLLNLTPVIDAFKINSRLNNSKIGYNNLKAEIPKEYFNTGFREWSC